MSSQKDKIISLGERLKLARKKSHIKQEDIGSLIGKTRETIGNYERGTTSPSVEDVEKISQILKVDFGWLITGQPDSSSNTYSKITETPIDHSHSESDNYGKSKNLEGEEPMSDSQKDQMIETQGKLIKTLEAKIEDLESKNLEKQKSQGRRKKSS